VKPATQRILVVEDDANIALGLREVLCGEGFEVLPCARGDLAVDLSRTGDDLARTGVDVVDAHAALSPAAAGAAPA
jgi:DNA-binding response OmpR family regulator